MMTVIIFLADTVVFFLWLVVAGAAVWGIGRRFERLAEAPYLDLAISVLTWIPWAVAFLWHGLPGLLAALVAQIAFLHTFCIVHMRINGRPERTLTEAQGRLLGPVRNQLALLVQTPAIFAFVAIRATQLFLYPLIAWLGRLPHYRQGEWVNLSRHRFSGLTGYDLLWCWYCDWMTGLWCLGTEMLRNIESFWCPVQFPRRDKNVLAEREFPDAAKWAQPDASVEDAVHLIEKYYSQDEPNRWWGHPDRKPPTTPE